MENSKLFCYQWYKLYSYTLQCVLFTICQRTHVKGSYCEIIGGLLGNEKEKYHFQSSDL